MEKVKKSFNTGLMRVKWIASFVAERTKAETSIAKLLYESNKLEGRIDELNRDIGKRVVELKDKEDRDVYNDFIIQQALDEIRHLQENVDDYKSQAKHINTLSE